MDYIIDGEKYKVEIVKKNNKNTYIRVKEDLTISVSTNYLVSKKSIKQLLDKNKSYLIKMIEKRKLELEKQQSFYYLGQIYDIIIMPSIKDIEIIGNRIYTKDNKTLEKWYKKQINDIFKQRLEYNYKIFNQNITCPSLKIRKMKTRWGVYNRKNHSITLNSNLIMYEIDKLDYVIIHELCHTIHFDHSKDFWNLVSKYVPNYKNIKKQLKD